ncbi:MAG: GntR family transcriptional regulator [Acidobacteria bacterium]|jgi:GntR family transcriptional regulator|nr:GntR family transcriptional regulator [Acidobacteriota bacterium]
MAQTILRRNDATPLHSQICEALRLQIQTTELKAGENFPSERELAELYGVSRMTVRQAVQRLRQDGLIYYERGVGTFVTNPKIDVHTRNLSGFSEEMLSLGLMPSSRALRLKREIADEQVKQDLHLETEGVEVFHLERLRLADDEPMAFEVTFLPAELCPKLDKADLTKNSLYQILVQNYNLQMHHAAESLEAAAATPFAAKQLGIKTDTPVLVVHRVVFSESNQPIESARTTYRADRYRATFYLSKNGR